jgi:splicing factor U2AF subunit
MLSTLNVITGNPDPITTVQFAHDRSMGMLEFKNTNDTTVCLALSGCEFEGKQLQIRRPKDYIVPLIAEDSGAPEPGQISSNVPDTPNKIMVAKIPEYIQDEQVIELLKSFGELKAFILVKDTTDDTSKVNSCTPY